MIVSQQTLPKDLEMYEELFCLKSTYAFGDGRVKWKSCSTSAMYAHYGKIDVIELLVNDLIGTRKSKAWILEKCLTPAYHLEGCGERWICLYIGEVATKPNSKRCARDRFRHEFALAGYFQQAPALEAICSLAYRSQKWSPITTRMGNGKWRTDLSNLEETSFFAWCTQNIRYAWVSVSIDPTQAKQKLTIDEKLLIELRKPLLNVRYSQNGFKDFVTEARHAFRGMRED